MFTLSRHFVVKTLSISLLVMGSTVASGQDYPSKAIRIITGSVGGSSDVTARIVGQGLAALGQPTVVENKLAGENADFVAKAPADGYTLLVVGSSVWINALLRPVTYDIVKDLAPITLVERTVNVLVVNPSLPVKSVKELIALAKARPGALNYASSGLGNSNHLATELFKSMTGVNIVHIAYKGTAPGMTSVLSGETQMIMVDVGFAAPHVKSGRMRALGVSSLDPSLLMPGVPTIAASGVPGYEYVNATGAWAPIKTPRALVTRLNQEIVRYVQRPDVKEKMLAAGIEPVGDKPEQFDVFIKDSIAKSSKVIKDAGIKAE